MDGCDSPPSSAKPSLPLQGALCRSCASWWTEVLVWSPPLSQSPPLQPAGSLCSAASRLTGAEEKEKKKRWPLSLVTRSGIGISVCHWGELTWLKHAAENVQVGSKKGVKKKQPVQSERCTHYKLFTCIFKKTFKPVLTRRLPTWTHAQIYLSITLHAEYLFQIFKYFIITGKKKYVANLMCVIFGTMRVFSAIQWPHSVTTPLLV